MASHANRFWTFHTAAAEYFFEQKVAKSRGDFTIKGDNKACLTVSSVTLVKDENLVRANASLFVPFATFPVLRSFSEGGCKNGLGWPRRARQFARSPKTNKPMAAPEATRVAPYLNWATLFLSYPKVRETPSALSRHRPSLKNAETPAG